MQTLCQDSKWLCGHTFFMNIFAKTNIRKTVCLFIPGPGKIFLATKGRKSRITVTLRFSKESGSFIKGSKFLCGLWPFLFFPCFCWCCCWCCWCCCWGCFTIFAGCQDSNPRPQTGLLPMSYSTLTPSLRRQRVHMDKEEKTNVVILYGLSC